MLDVFGWSEKYSVRVATLDGQHRRLFAIADRLQQALGTGNATSVVDGILNELVQYTITHFTAEEGLLRKNGYPDLAAHQAEHQEFREKLELFQQQYAAGNREVVAKVTMFLIHWLRAHIVRTDRRYADFLNSKGVH